MKNIICLSLIIAGTSLGTLEKWTNKEGVAADLDLIRVMETNGEKSGEFKMHNGKTVILKAADLSQDSITKLAAWQPPAPVIEGKPSIFDEVLDGNLVVLSGESLKKADITTRPKKYYVFYYTASWCGPCQKFTPSLVSFYEKHKNGNFEIVLISSDRNEKAMEAYAVNKKMPWPQLKLSKVPEFKTKFKHGVTGIPSVIVCDLEGKNLGNFRNLVELEKLVK